MSWFCPPIRGFIVSALVVAVFASLPARAADKWQWILDQQDVEGGRNRLTFTADAVHVINFDRGYEVLAAAPSWNIVVFRRQDKVEYTGDLKSFRFSPLGALDMVWNHYPNLKPIGRESRKNLPFQLVKYHTPDRNDFCMVDSAGISGLAPEIGTVLEYYYHLPIAGIPYESFYNFSAKPKKKREVTWLSDEAADFDGRKPWLWTTKLQKTPYKATEFQYPQGFTMVKDQSKILLSNSKVTNMNAIVNEFNREDEAKAASEKRLRLQKMQLERLRQMQQRQVVP